MRLWSIHPRYLDAKGLVALWREGLLAQSVLQGKTKGYRNHPQLLRFKNTENPVGAIAGYLNHIADEAENRGYDFNRDKIAAIAPQGSITVSNGQLEYEFKHLLNKLQHRDKNLFEKLKTVKKITIHPTFTRVKGEVENWEKSGTGK